MSCILHRNPAAELPAVTSAKGAWMTDTEGRTYLDAVSGGAAVTSIGHGDQRVREAIDHQLAHVAYAHSSFFTSTAAEALAEELIEKRSAKLSRAIFCSGGSEAVESALKLARQFWLERDRPKKRKIIARRQSYHGGTLGALSVGGNMPRREPYSPMLFEACFIEPCYAYRLRGDNESEEEYGLRAARALETEILSQGAENVAAFIAEPVVGATLGCAPAVKGYLSEISRICERYEVLLILDEIMCGCGRTGTFFAFEQDGVAPDIVTLAKGLGGGYQPIGAILIGSMVAETIENTANGLQQGYTYMGHPVACAAALAVQQVMREDGLVEQARVRGAQLYRMLQERLADHPHVGDIRGRGLFQAVELVRERSNKTPFDPDLRAHAQVKAAAMRNGLLVYPSGGTFDGRRGDHVLLAPAYVISEKEIEAVVDRLTAVLDDTLIHLQESQ